MFIRDLVIVLGFTVGFLILLFVLIKIKRDWLKVQGNIDMSLVIIALLPFVAYLILSGRVKQLTVGDFNVTFVEEARATEVAALVPQEQRSMPLEVEPTHPFAKGSVHDLRSGLLQQIQQQRSTTMIIDARPEIFYNASALRAYLLELSRYDFFKYVVFLEAGQFRGWMMAGSFMALLEVRGSQVEEWINRRDFAALAREGMHTEKIDAKASALEALRLLRQTGQENIAVLEATGKLVGIASRDGIISQIVSRALVNENK
ncbi:MAG: hypothetical protein ONB44_20360 [candidate division KSB1 bacterium]|nr:hypothetical protein [candidate division KSB1 bacterium]MDZ7304484.1 hypothetical protein [candidate division KSB1 bacterium]MDZ7312991.1 hypothetical protein [candidate division KSB1 bacterium]